MAAIGGSFGVQSSRISITTPTLSSSSLFPSLTILQPCNKKDNQLKCALQESSTSTVATDKSKSIEQEDDSTVAVPAKKQKPAAAKAVAAKPLKQMMEEDVIPPLKTILEAQDDISEIDLSFQDDKLEGFFLKKGIQYSFWAFFPTGNLTGAKGFSIASYGSGPSTVEPFLVDERKPTAKHVVFWVEKRLAAQGIIPVWNQ